MSTSPYAEVIGDPVHQSKSPAIHRHWIERLGLDADYRATPVKDGDLGEYFAARRADPCWRGCNVTMPHKQAVMPYLDRLDPQASRIGAVNTIVRDEAGLLAGHNTDAAGFLEPLRPMLARSHLFRMARVLGTGGAARAIITALVEQNVMIVLAGRDPAKASALLEALDPGGEHSAVSLDWFAEPTEFVFDDREGCFDLIVNASPLGMTGEPPLHFDFSHAPPGSLVYDIVTSPIDTPFLKAARAAGFRTLDGLNMLIGQAALAFRLFFSASAPRDDADAELRRRLTL